MVAPCGLTWLPLRNPSSLLKLSRISQRRECRHQDRSEKSCILSLLWVRVFPCGCTFSHVGASFQLAHPFDKMKSRRHKRGGAQVFPSHVGASFQLAHPFDKMKSCRHKERWPKVFPSHVGASFQLALPFDKMKSCRHKRYRHLILNWFQARGFLNCGSKFSHVGASFPTWQQVFPCGCEFSTCTSPTR